MSRNLLYNEVHILSYIFSHEKKYSAHHLLWILKTSMNMDEFGQLDAKDSKNKCFQIDSLLPLLVVGIGCYSFKLYIT